MSVAKSRLNRRKADAVLREAVIQLLSLRMRSNSSPKALRLFAESCVHAASLRGQVSKQAVAQADVHHIGSVLRAWHRETRYLTDDGFPKPLTFAGKNGLRQLVIRFCPEMRPDSVLSTLTSANLIGKTSNGRWIPNARFGVMPRFSNEVYEHIADGVSRFVETVTQNVSRPKGEDPLFERSAKVRRFPVSDAAEFRKFVNQQATTFLCAVDDWLEARAESRGKSRAKKCNAGVFAFAFMDVK